MCMGQAVVIRRMARRWISWIKAPTEARWISILVVDGRFPALIVVKRCTTLYKRCAVPEAGIPCAAPEPVEQHAHEMPAGTRRDKNQSRWQT